MEELIKRAEEGDDRAQYQLGLAYYNGNGIKQSNRDAYFWFQRSAEQGHHEAQCWLDKLMPIHVIIDGGRYPLIIERTNEYLYRQAAKYLNEKLNFYRGSFIKKTTIEQWAMTAYDLAFETIKYKDRNDTKPYKDKLEELSKELDELLK